MGCFEEKRDGGSGAGGLPAAWTCGRSLRLPRSALTPVFQNTLLCFTVHGFFKEVDGKSRDSVRAFTRMFIAVPAGNSGLCIVNDELFVRGASAEELRKAFALPAPTPSSSPVPTLSAEQQEMLAAFAMQSGMNLEWSQKCLQDNDWDYGQAGQVFTQLKLEGKIPEVAFLK
ncbi:nuclear RNA export factor 1-like [Chamaea fasciata]|uniref:nuclear RNA export factor 1-like n=1 Tax=Chamaea fasciata TaxID=190680 RepID=UPI00336ACBC9